MSSLWTPGGEVPVDRNRSDAEPAEAGPGEAPADEPAAVAGPARPAAGDDQLRDQLADLQAQLLQAPAAEVVVQHAAGLYELAALHVTQEPPRLGEARLAIDALRGILDATGDSLGAAGQQLRQLVHQLQLAVIERAGGSGEPPSTEP